jgi:hypothetical protein
MLSLIQMKFTTDIYSFLLSFIFVFLFFYRLVVVDMFFDEKEKVKIIRIFEDVLFFLLFSYFLIQLKERFYVNY